MLLNLMDYIRVKKPLNVWDKYSIRPGAVGSVGDTLAQIRVKQSAPDMTPKYMPWSYGEMEKYYGSNVQDGRAASFMSGGYNAKTEATMFMRTPSDKTVVGWRHQDIAPVDRSRETRNIGVPQYSHHSKTASVLRAKVTGDLFLPSPGGYGPAKGEISRGGAYPSKTIQTQEVLHPPTPINPLIQTTQYPQETRRQAIAQRNAITDARLQSLKRGIWGNF